VLYGNFDTFYTLDANDEFGHAAAAVGDINGDGIGDLAVGAHNDDDGGTNAGAVYMLLLESNGIIKSAQKVSMLYGSFSAFYTLDPDDGFGCSIALLGDINNDGIADLVVGAAGDDDSTINAGAAYILFLDTNFDVNEAQKLSMNYSDFGTFYTLDANDGFGVSLAALGDVDIDGVVDIAAGAHDDNDGGTYIGAVYVLFLETNGNVKDAQKLSMIYGNFSSFYSLTAGDQFGDSVAGIGDMNGDGMNDMVVGAYKDADKDIKVGDCLHTTEGPSIVHTIERVAIKEGDMTYSIGLEGSFGAVAIGGVFTHVMSYTRIRGHNIDISKKFGGEVAYKPSAKINKGHIRLPWS